MYPRASRYIYMYIHMQLRMRSHTSTSAVMFKPSTSAPQHSIVHVLTPTCFLSDVPKPKLDRYVCICVRKLLVYAELLPVPISTSPSPSPPPAAQRPSVHHSLLSLSTLPGTRQPPVASRYYETESRTRNALRKNASYRYHYEECTRARNVCLVTNKKGQRGWGSGVGFDER